MKEKAEPDVACDAVIDVNEFTPLVAEPKPPTTPDVVPSVVETPLPLTEYEFPIRVAADAAPSTVN